MCIRDSRRAEKQGPQRRQTNLVPTEPLQRRNYTTRGSSPFAFIAVTLLQNYIASSTICVSKEQVGGFFYLTTHTQHSTSCKLQTKDSLSKSKLVHLRVKIAHNRSCADMVLDAIIVFIIIGNL